MKKSLLTVGWREWCSLPDLGFPLIKTKVDTGAKTSCLHAFTTETYDKNGEKWVRFGMHPHQGDIETAVFCDAEVTDIRDVTDSGGHTESRLIITTQIIMGEQQWPTEFTLTNRDSMRFRMLLGRTAMKNKIMVDPGASYLLGRPK